mmetsp:Transcript_77012/g.198319  ORF Transcript_77012/g.198319 Transcript_77012/m.198319 type:complete len:214 (-) Transcript_77012:1024-1665(-)
MQCARKRHPRAGEDGGVDRVAQRRAVGRGDRLVFPPVQQLGDADGPLPGVELDRELPHILRGLPEVGPRENPRQPGPSRPHLLFHHTRLHELRRPGTLRAAGGVLGPAVQAALVRLHGAADYHHGHLHLDDAHHDRRRAHRLHHESAIRLRGWLPRVEAEVVSWQAGLVLLARGSRVSGDHDHGQRRAQASAWRQGRGSSHQHQIDDHNVEHV